MKTLKQRSIGLMPEFYSTMVSIAKLDKSEADLQWKNKLIKLVHDLSFELEKSNSNINKLEVKLQETNKQVSYLSTKVDQAAESATKAIYETHQGLTYVLDSLGNK